MKGLIDRLSILQSLILIDQNKGIAREYNVQSLCIDILILSQCISSPDVYMIPLDWAYRGQVWCELKAWQLFLFGTKFNLFGALIKNIDQIITMHSIKTYLREIENKNIPSGIVWIVLLRPSEFHQKPVWYDNGRSLFRVKAW